jgi:hypothetical protein
MPKYIKRLLESKDFKTVRESTIMISRKDKEWMEAEELKSYFNSLMKDAKKDNVKLDVMIRVLAGTRWFTVKGKSGGLNIKSVEEYFEGRVKDEQKFALFSQIHVTVWKPKKIDDFPNVKEKEKEGVKEKDDKKKKENTDEDEDEEDEVIQKIDKKLKKSK